ncbi:hypothetical protein OAL35_01450 [bacterium]|nr:hypothetical protein [bacterium]
MSISIMPTKAILLSCLAVTTLLTQQKSSYAEQSSLPNPLQLAIDCRDLSRRLIEAELQIPVSPRKESSSLALWYPKWVPGSHGPGGPIANIAGLQIYESDGTRLNWKRSPGEVYRIEVELPADTSKIIVSMRYVANQPTTTSFGHDCFTSPQIAVISPSCLLLYPEGADIDQQKIDVNLLTPHSWKLASALPQSPSADTALNKTFFGSVSLRTLADSPIMIGTHYRSIELVDDQTSCPPHTLHLFADDDESTNLDQDVIDLYARMVKQSALLIGSHPFDRFDILLAVTTSLPKNGLEHARSTLNVLPPQSLRSPSALKGWDRLLVPHEYIHAWCGKYRRPKGMLTTDFHTPKDTELLWVYEGLTQYLGELIEARARFMSKDEFRHRLLVELRNATHQQGRQWRTLADTASASHILRTSSPNWGGLRRSQDYYMEGMLFWLEADARIRSLTNNKKSLDDFCRSFFKASQRTKNPKAFDRQEVIKHLQRIAKDDWEGLIIRRVESYQQQFDPELASLLGYHFEKTTTIPNIPPNTFRYRGGIDLLDSVGVFLSVDGKVQRILLGSVAEKAGMAPDDQVIAVGELKWSPDRILNAFRNAERDRTPVSLLLSRAEEMKTLQIHHDAGLKYWNLTRDLSKPDLLEKILMPISGTQK